MKLKGKVLIANTGEDTLTYLDIEKGEVIEIIDLKTIGSSPIGPYELISIDNLFVYCINIYENSLYKINMEKRKIVDTLYIGTYPTCISFFKNCFYIVNTDSNSISVVDVESFSLMESIPVGEKPMDMEIDEINEKIYVANSNNSSISRIDLNSNENIIINLENNPLKMILEGNQIYILSNINNSLFQKCNISLLDLETLKEKKFIELNGTFNTMIKINSSEIIFTTNIDNGYLYRIDIKKKNILSKTNLLGLPNKLVWDGNRMVYITNLSTNTLSLFDIKTSNIIKSIKVGIEPNGILFFP
ncbi:MAG: YncE family protein [Tissierellia bacterium]|nr:YncE family protein [Tissierellia bacterium]